MSTPDVSTGVDAPGPVLFARYAYPPNALGFCGRNDHRALLEYGSQGVSDRGLVDLAKGFGGAWPYLELLAASASRRASGGPLDPLDRAVVEAYWIGSPMSHSVPPGALARSLDDRFRRDTGRRWDQVLSAAEAGLPVCHAFHVFAVYPWTGLLGSRASEHALHVLDRCRIRWGEVIEVDADATTVRTRQLTWNGQTLALGPPSVEHATWRTNGLGLVSALVPGDIVALHWDWVCDRLTARQQARLEAATEDHLCFVNHRSSTQPDGVPTPSLAPVLDR